MTYEINLDPKLVVSDLRGQFGHYSSRYARSNDFAGIAETFRDIGRQLPFEKPKANGTSLGEKFRHLSYQFSQLAFHEQLQVFWAWKEDFDEFDLGDEPPSYAAKTLTAVKRAVADAKAQCVETDTNADTNANIVWEEMISHFYVSLLQAWCPFMDPKILQEKARASAPVGSTWDEKEAQRWPYGMWACEDGREILFDRARQQLAVRGPNQKPLRVVRYIYDGAGGTKDDGVQAHDLEGKRFYFDDDKHKSSTILAAFMAGKPVTKFIHVRYRNGELVP
jgi:hypothetical protein